MFQWTACWLNFQIMLEVGLDSIGQSTIRRPLTQCMVVQQTSTKISKKNCWLKSNNF
jgi:hypothetical protein